MEDSGPRVFKMYELKEVGGKTSNTSFDLAQGKGKKETNTDPGGEREGLGGTFNLRLVSYG